MSEVYFTSQELAGALGLHEETVRRYLRRATNPFPNAVKHGGRKLGYRIPSGDALAFARQEFPWRVIAIERQIAEKRAEEGASSERAS